jgi:peptidoglycan/LPS O-acetylase OafA/YrhL
MSGVTMPNESPHKGQLGRWPALDGLRALAVVLVMFNHLDLSGIFGGGSIGVDIFFVLSGFLITTLLIGEFEKTDRINFGAFYARRALRLLPALAAVIVVAVLLVTLVHELHLFKSETLTTLPFVIFFVGNWARVFDFNALGVLAHTWSLGIEEQFYLVWPLLFVLLAARRRRELVALVLTGIAGLVMVYRFVLLSMGQHPWSLYFRTDTHCDGLLIGCALAFWLASGKMASPVVERLFRWATVPALLIILFISELIDNNDPKQFHFMVAYGLGVSVLCSAVLIANQVTSPLPELASILKAPIVVWIGRRSYGLYLWHFLIYRSVGSFFREHHPTNTDRITELALKVGISFIVAAISYKVIEMPALRLKRRFQPTEAVPVADAIGGVDVLWEADHAQDDHPDVAPSGPTPHAPET